MSDVTSVPSSDFTATFTDHTPIRLRYTNSMSDEPAAAAVAVVPSTQADQDIRRNFNFPLVVVGTVRMIRIIDCMLSFLVGMLSLISHMLSFLVGMLSLISHYYHRRRRT